MLSADKARQPRVQPHPHQGQMMEQEAEHLKGSLRAYRGQLTMKVKRSIRAIKTAELSPTKQAFSDLKARKDDLADAISKLEEATKKGDGDRPR